MVLFQTNNLMFRIVTLTSLFVFLIVTVNLNNVYFAVATKSQGDQTSTELSTQSSKPVKQSAKIQASGTPEDIGKQLVNKLNQIVKTPGVDPTSIKITCTVSYPPLKITCNIDWFANQATNLNSSKSN